eukprot:TRINITY_DN58537_c0_g1_i1.p1 TRINITY_DN58537_c0_g1~~TRINITY_DN58537_c0_g1_i1.p1  ORF type:complete len:513 (+),score=50.03 TRINITY_DN58537_c0_g1_i1:132-1670(+)
MVLAQKRAHYASKRKRFVKQKGQKPRRPQLIRVLRACPEDASLILVEPRSVGVNPAALTKYEAAMKLASRKALMPGCASVVLRHGELVQAQAFGYADLEMRKPFRLDTICRIFCVTKTYVTVVFMMLVEEGRVRLEDPVAKFLPEFADIMVVGTRASDEAQPSLLCKPKRVMRMSHLVTHTSGLSYGCGFGNEPGDATEEGYARLVDAVDRGRVRDLADFTSRLAKIPLRFHPGDRYAYGFSTDVLGRVLEVITGQSLEACLHERLFAPLGMHDTSFSVPDDKLDRFAACYGNASTWGRLYGKFPERVPRVSRQGLVRLDGDTNEDSAWRRGNECKVMSGGGIMGHFQGGLVSTVADTCRFVRMLVRRGVTWNGQRLLTEETVTAMETNRKDSGLVGEERQCLLGALAGFSGEEFGWGGAACTYWSVDRKEDNAIVWFTQHIDMQEWEDQVVVNKEHADIWTVLCKGTRRCTKNMQALKPAVISDDAGTSDRKEADLHAPCRRPSSSSVLKR